MVEKAETLERVADELGGPGRGPVLWAMMETPLGMLNAAAIAAHPRLAGMVMGTNDLAKDLGSRFRADRRNSGLRGRDGHNHAAQ